MTGGVPSDVPIWVVLAFLAGMVALLLMLIFTSIIMSYCTQPVLLSDIQVRSDEPRGRRGFSAHDR